MKLVKCGICNSGSYKDLFKTKDYDADGKILFNIVKCKKCNVAYVNPQPDKEFLSTYYAFNYYGNQSFFYRIFLFINDFIIKNKASLILKKKKGTLLDVGCGDGDFLKFMENNGWNVFGVEPSKSGAILARKKIQGSIYNRELKNVKFPKKFFDVITIWHVLEHVKNPNEMIKEVSRIIKDKGILIVAVPNIDSFQAKIGGKKWFHLDVPRHLYHFSPQVLEKLLEKNGFKVEKIKHFSFVYNLIGIVQTWLNMIGIKFNFLHHLVKRVDRERNYINFDFVYNFFFTLFFSALFFLPSLIFSLTESFFKHGATITVYAKKIF